MRKLEERLGMININMETIEKTQIKHQEMKNIISEMKNTWAGIINALLVTEEEKMNEFEDAAIETTQNETGK